MIIIDKNKCIRCTKCVKDCFPGALSYISGEIELRNAGACLHCGHCIAICPNNAVTDTEAAMDTIVQYTSPPSSEDILSAMKLRRSCRQYKITPVPDGELFELISAAQAAPTAKNLQRTRYVVVRNKMKLLLTMALHTLSGLGEAQLKASTDENELRRARNFISWNQQHQADTDFDPLFFHAGTMILFITQKGLEADTAAAAAYSELLAASKGFGTLYSGYFTAAAANSPEIRHEIGLQDTETLVRTLVVGYPAVGYRRSAPRFSPDIRML